MLPDVTERALVVLAQAGDQVAFGELVRRRQSQIRGLFRHLSRDHALGDDLAQDAFLVAWQRLRQLREPSRFGPWLRQIAVTTWLQHARLRRIPVEPLRDGDGSPAGPASNSLERLDLDAALQRLGSGERLCVVLAYREGMSHAEVAAATGFPLGTVKSHVSRGVVRLRQWLSAPIEGGHE